LPPAFHFVAHFVDLEIMPGHRIDKVDDKVGDKVPLFNRRVSVVNGDKV